MTRTRFPRFPVSGLLLAVLLLHLAPARGDALPLADPEVVRAAAAEATLDRYPDADEVYVFSAEHVRYEPDGTSVSVRENWIRVLTERGRRQRSGFGFGFNAFYGDVEVRIAEIHRPDGTVAPVDIEAQSRVMIAPDQMHKNIYDPNQKVLRLGIPGLAIGDTVRVVSVRRQTRTRMPDTWADFTVFESPAPIVHAVYEVDAPDALPLHHRVIKGEIPGTIDYAEEPGDPGRTRHRWTARDVPRLHPEPSMPDWWTVCQRLLVSTIPDWETVSRWYWELSLPRLESTTPAMAEKVAELTEGLDDRQARIEALFLFVSQQVRYMGLTHEEVAPGYEPRDVHVTFENRYGVCRDKAALLVAMLRLAGFEAFPVLIHVGPRKDEEVPQPFFNHAIVAVREPDGGYQLMDMTDETTRELLPAYLNDRSYLVASPEGATLLTSPIVPAEENLVHIETSATLDAHGDLAGTTHIRLDGINDNAYRGFFASIRPSERRRFFEGLIKRVLPGAELQDFTLTPADMQDTTQGIEARLGFRVREAVVDGEDVRIPTAPWFGTAVGMANFILRDTGLRERRFPLRTGYACGVRERFTLELGPAAGPAPLALPDFDAVDQPGLAWRQALRADGTTLEGEAEFVLRTTEFDPEAYLELKDALRTIEFNRRRLPLFPAPAADREDAEADVRYALRRTEIALDEDGGWTETTTVRKTVATYAGIKDHSEVRVPFNPAWDEVELLEARVTQPDGTVSEVRDGEVNLMDAPWVGSAPRYPAGRVLVANLPGVRVGSTIETVVRRRRQRPFFSARHVFGGSDPIAEAELVFEGPADRVDGLALVLGAERLDIEETPLPDGRRRLRWRRTDIPPTAREDHLPPGWLLHPAVLLSEGDWTEHARRVGEQLEAASRDQPEAERAAREAVAGIEDPTERVRVLRDLVVRRIREAGPAFTDLPIETLTPADRTLADGYGHGADRAILLAALLRAAGFEPSFVLASAWPADSAAVAPLLERPAPGLFPRVLVEVEADGRLLMLNDTDQYAAPGTTAHDGRQGLRLPEGRPLAIAAAPGHARASHTEMTLRIEADGGSAIEVVRRFEGTAHAAARRRFDEMTPEDRRRYHQEAVAGISQRAEPDGDLVTDFERYPGEERFSVKVDLYAVREGDFLLLHLPGLGPVLPMRADRRTHGIWWTDRGRETTTLRVRPPEGVRPALWPPALDWAADGEAVAVRQSARPAPDGEGWIVERTVARTPALIPAVQYGALLEAQRTLAHRRNRLLLFEVGEEE